MSAPHILIIGGGIGGLALAHGLKKHGIHFTLFERDLSASARAQGYRLRIAGGGIESLRQCLDDETWDLFERTCCATTQFGHSRLNAVDGSELLSYGPPGGRGGARMKPNLEMKHAPDTGLTAHIVDRTMLRNLLLLGQESHIKFNKSFERYEITATGVRAFFSDGTTEEGNMLVGADGVVSLVRKQLLPHHRYVDTGSRVIYGKTPLTPELETHFPAEALKWVTVTQDSNPLTLYSEPVRFPNDASIESGGRLPRTADYVYWVFGGSVEHFGIPDSEFHALSSKAAAELTLKLTEHWAPAFRAVFELQIIEQSAPLRLLSAKPERPIWESSDRVTLLGDAAHAMMPAGGSGANTALGDAALLTKLVADRGIGEGMVGEYIDGMWEYALTAIQGSAMGGKKLLGFKGFEDAREVDL